MSASMDDTAAPMGVTASSIPTRVLGLSDGQFRGMIGVNVDVTEREEAESRAA